MSQPESIIRLLITFSFFTVAGHCRYATAWHGQYRGRTASQHQHSRDSETLHRRETVRELLTHSDNDPLQLNAKNLYISAVTRKLSLVSFFHDRLSFRHLYPISFPHGEGVCERFFIKLTMPGRERKRSDAC
jgi:hypothetical protein